MSRARLLAVASIASSLIPLAAGAAHWPQFRGPNGLGIAEGVEPPIFFNSQSNVLWRTALPQGHSSPCLWGDRIFLTGYDGQKLETIALDRTTGAVLWRKPAPAKKIEPVHRIASPASPTPVTDGERVYSYFGSFGVLACDPDGRELWRAPLPLPIVEFGTGSSPLLAGENVIVLCDQDEGSFLVAFNQRTGKESWRVTRPEFRRGFSTPHLWIHDGIHELIVPGSIWLTSYNPRDGTERWRYSGTSRVANSTPVHGNGLLFYASWNIGGDEGARITMPPFEPFAREHDADKDGMFTREEIPAGPVRDRFTQIDLNKDGLATSAEWQNMAEMFERAENAVIAIRPGGSNDITRTHLAWKTTRSLPYVSSPLCYRDRLYTVKNGGLFSCYEAATGKVIVQDERMGAAGDYYSSAVAAGGTIFVASQRGVVLAIRAGDSFEVLARNDLREEIFATPAIVDGTLYVRTTKALYAFSARK
jgi:outer membrane protein assembly factor BamB